MQFRVQFGVTNLVMIVLVSAMAFAIFSCQGKKISQALEKGWEQEFRRIVHATDMIVENEASLGAEKRDGKSSNQKAVPPSEKIVEVIWWLLFFMK